jgi:hypothetical protein
MQLLTQKTENFCGFLILLAFFTFFAGCKEDQINNFTNQVSYTELYSVQSGTMKISLYVSGQDSLTTGYNKVYFKVWDGSNELNTGYIKFFPKMWMTPTYAHSTPVSDSFKYEYSINYFKGYAIFNMPTSPPDVIWWGFITYKRAQNDSIVFDSTAMYTSYHREKQWRFFYDSTSQYTYMLTLLEPWSPKTGLNNFHVMLHETDAQLYYHKQINNAEMFLRVYELTHDSVSSGNVSPSGNSDGIYRGKINLPYSSEWKITDTIKYNGRYITNNPPPIPEFYFDLR